MGHYAFTHSVVPPPERVEGVRSRRRRVPTGAAALIPEGDLP